MNNRAGQYRINLSGEAEYKSFVPTMLPPNPDIEIDTELLSLLINANKALAALESVSAHIPDMELFVSMYVRKEALMSSQIEGTQATLEDVLDPMIEKNMNRNVADVVNYIRATEYSVKRLETLPLCNRLIKETHAILMENAHGQEKNPGEFRRSQNWIGGHGSTLKTAKYIPPNQEDMQDAMSALEKYMNEDDDTDTLIKAALIHYQFETVHPFLDGNGRVGRLLITLYLIEKNVLTTPALYISYFLKKNRIEYYDRMTEVRSKGNYEQWIKFFLAAIDECARDAVGTINILSDLKKKNEEKISLMGRASENTMRVFNYLKSHPIIDIGKTADALSVSFNTVSSAVKRLEAAGILVKTENAFRNRTFVYKDYLEILKNGT